MEVERQRYREFALASRAPVALHDCDADGLGAAVLWQRTLERAGLEPRRVCTNRLRNAWDPANREAVAALAPDRLFVLDLGCNGTRVLPAVPTCYVDHHRPEPAPEGDLLITSYTMDPIPPTAWLAYQLAWVDVSDLAWLAALGIVGDLGEKSPFLADVPGDYKLSPLKNVVALVNAARRSSRYDPEQAARALLAAPGPAQLLKLGTPEVAFLHECKAEVAAALAEGKKAAPRFSGEVALVRVNSPCQIHPVIAQIWRGRLPKYYVLVANEGYLPGRVHFSARCSGERNLLQFLGQFKQRVPGNYGFGHDQASGGAVSTAEWEQLLAALGFL